MKSGAVRLQLEVTYDEVLDLLYRLPSCDLARKIERRYMEASTEKAGKIIVVFDHPEALSFNQKVHGPMMNVRFEFGINVFTWTKELEEWLENMGFRFEVRPLRRSKRNGGEHGE